MAPKKPASFSQRKVNAVSLEERMSGFLARKQSTGLNWREVSACSLRSALHTSIAEGVAVMFSGAAGGLGVCLTLFMDGDRKKEYVMTSEEMNVLLDMVTDAFASSSEDVRTAMLDGAA